MTIPHFYKILMDVKDWGKIVVSRGLETREVVGYEYQLPPRVRFMCFDDRKLKMDYVKQEFMWYMVGVPTDHSICKVAKMWQGLINEDKSINSNYGYYIFNPDANVSGKNNFQRVAETLMADPQSRRAVLMILGSQHLNSMTKDYPCTVYMNFLIRDNKLLLFVRMRSQDAIYGMGNDAPFFSFVHEMMYWTLKSDKQFKDLEMGQYTHSADSFHVYARHYEMMDKILEEPVVSVDEHDHCPAMTRLTPLYLLKLRQELLKERPNFEGVRLDPFVNWLLTREDPSTLLLPEIA